MKRNTMHGSEGFHQDILANALFRKFQVVNYAMVSILFTFYRTPEQMSLLRIEFAKRSMKTIIPNATMATVWLRFLQAKFRMMNGATKRIPNIVLLYL